MRFIKENPALAAGIGLPVLLVALFSLAALIPKWTVAPPEYDVVFSVRAYDCNNLAEARFKLIDGGVKGEYHYPEKKNNYVNCQNNQRLYRFNAKTLTTREITFNIPAGREDNYSWQELDVPEIKQLKVVNNIVSPDGYKFLNEERYYSRGFSLFGGGYNYRKGITIAKNGRVVDLSPSSEVIYSYDNTYFLGWVISGDAVNE